MVAAAALCVGISAGTVELVVIARAESMGQAGFAGVLLATLAMSSMIGGFLYGGRKWRAEPRLLWLLSVAALAGTLLLLNLATSLWLLAGVLFLVGFAVAPCGIAGMVLLERVLPQKKLNEGLSVEMTAMTVGMAIGGWLAGLVTDSMGTLRAFAIPGISVLVGVAITLLGYRALRSHVAEQPEPAAVTE